LALEQRRIGRRIITTLNHTRGDTPLTGRFWFLGREGAVVTTNGLPAKPTLKPMSPSGMNRSCLDIELIAGAELRIEHEEP